MAACKRRDYYPFGMQMPGRSFEATGNQDYRYGFNGKEQDKDMHSLTAYDYGFRIYNPAIGKFLSVDPLTKSYPWYTPYQFAGNKPVKFIDLDGLEEIDPIVVIQQPKSKGEPGLGQTTARKVYFVVTSGFGAVSQSDQSSINVTKINSKLNSTPNEPATMNSTAIYNSFYDLSDREWRHFNGASQKRKDEVINSLNDPLVLVAVEFDLDITVKADMTLEKCLSIVQTNPSKYGVILNSIDNVDIITLNIPSAIADLLKDANTQFARHSNPGSNEAEAYGSIKNSINKAGIDLIVLNKNLNSARTLSMNSIIIHEFGHNATDQSHGKRYSYSDNGLQSNEENRMQPSRKNKIDIIVNSNVNNIYDKIILNPSDKT